MRKEQKKFEEQKWNWTGELSQRAAQLNAREEEIAKHERELAKRENDVRKQEAFLEEEKAKVLAQYKRVKKLERQGKRREQSSIGKRADPNSVRTGTRPIGRYTGRVSGWKYCHPLRIGRSSGGLRWRQNPTRVKLLKVGWVTVGGRVTRCNGRIAN